MKGIYQIKIIDVSSLKFIEIETMFNKEYSNQGWKLIQILCITELIKYLIIQRESIDIYSTITKQIIA